MTIKKVPSHLWNEMMSESAHLVVFGEHRSSALERCDFALLAIMDNNEVGGYVTCMEMDQETLYWQHGGAMPEHRGTVYTISGYSKLINWCCEHYKRITTRVENENVVMLKIAMKLGFRIVGTSNFKNKIFVELLNEL